MCKNIRKSTLIFLITALSCVFLLVLVCQIPQSLIQENSVQSARYFMDQEAFPLTFGRFLNSRGDNYADSNLLNVIYNTDPQKGFSGIVEAPYYRVEGESAQNNYFDTVIDARFPNTNYARYWHGSQVLIRPLLTLFPVNGIRLVLFFLLIGLNLWFSLCLWKRKYHYPLIIYWAGLVLTQFWMCAASLEYIMTYLVMAAICIAVYYLYGKSKDTFCTNKAICLFIVSGTVTSFLDFLTTETLTFTVPFLLLILFKMQKDQLRSFRQELKEMVLCGFSWLTSYGLMFLVKWGLVYITLGKQSFMDSLQSAAVRMDGSIAAEGLSAGQAGTLFQQITGALVRNLACLFPVSSDVTISTVVLLVFAVLLVCIAVFYLFRKDPVNGCFIAIMVLIAMIPYARFICLSNHSYIHYFFTYRSQMAATMSPMSILLYSIRPVKKIAAKPIKSQKKSLR